jgi:hypothetical protein
VKCARDGRRTEWAGRDVLCRGRPLCRPEASVQALRQIREPAPRQSRLEGGKPHRFHPSTLASCACLGRPWPGRGCREPALVGGHPGPPVGDDAGRQLFDRPDDHTRRSRVGRIVGDQPNVWTTEIKLDLVARAGWVHQPAARLALRSKRNSQPRPDTRSTSRNAATLSEIANI